MLLPIIRSPMPIISFAVYYHKSLRRKSDPTVSCSPQPLSVTLGQPLHPVYSWYHLLLLLQARASHAVVTAPKVSSATQTSATATTAEDVTTAVAPKSNVANAEK